MAQITNIGNNITVRGIGGKHVVYRPAGKPVPERVRDMFPEREPIYQVCDSHEAACEWAADRLIAERKAA